MQDFLCQHSRGRHGHITPGGFPLGHPGVKAAAGSGSRQQNPCSPSAPADQKPLVPLTVKGECKNIYSPHPGGDRAQQQPRSTKEAPVCPGQRCPALEKLLCPEVHSKSSLPNSYFCLPSQFAAAVLMPPWLPDILRSLTLLFLPSSEEFQETQTPEAGSGHQEGNTSQMGLPRLVPKTCFWREPHSSTHS